MGISDSSLKDLVKEVIGRAALKPRKTDSQKYFDKIAFRVTHQCIVFKNYSKVKL